MPPCLRMDSAEGATVTTQGTGVGLASGVGEAIGVGLALGVGEGFGLGLGSGVGEAFGVGLELGVGDAFGVGLASGLGDGLGLGDGVARLLPLTVEPESMPLRFEFTFTLGTSSRYSPLSIVTSPE